MSSIFKALSTEFDDYSVFNTDNANVLVVATNGGNLRYLDSWVFEHAPLSHDMRRVGLARVQDLELRRIGSRALLQPTFAALSAPSNSDYFPYVSLHAPRSRYLGESAVDLTRLHVAPIPVAEMLDPYVQRNDQPHTTGSYFAPAQSRDTAARLVQALSTDALTATHGDVAPAIREGLESGACAGPVEDEHLLMQRLGWLAGATNPYLRGKSLDRMWDRLGQRLCSDRLSPEIRDWFLLHRAVGRRDAPAMLQISRRLIATAGLQSNLSELDYLLAAGLTGALASGDAEGARHVAATFASIYPAGTEPPFYLRLLLLQR